MGQLKSGETVLVAGRASNDAELKTVGENNTKICEFSLMIGKQEDGKGIFANCKAWRELAEFASYIKKGDSVCVVGRLESREYNGKTYTSVVADWVSLAGAKGSATSVAPHPSSAFKELPDEPELPF